MKLTLKEPLMSRDVYTLTHNTILLEVSTVSSLHTSRLNYA